MLVYVARIVAGATAIVLPLLLPDVWPLQMLGGVVYGMLAPFILGLDAIVDVYPVKQIQQAALMIKGWRHIAMRHAVAVAIWVVILVAWPAFALIGMRSKSILFFLGGALPGAVVFVAMVRLFARRNQVVE